MTSPPEQITAEGARPVVEDAEPPGHPLDNPVWAALTGPHGHFAEWGVGGLAAHYQPDVTPFAALPDEPDAAAWADLAALVGPGASAALARARVAPPPGWEVLWRGEGVQMVDTGVEVAPDPEAEVLGPDDVPEMLALVTRTKPGPFLPRTRELGTYLGIRRDGELVAMAGERLHVPGWTEISAVCTDAGHRRQGLGARLVRAVAAVIRARGETPFLHAVASNTTAIRLYEALGFAVRREVEFVAVQPPSPRVPHASACRHDDAGG